MSGHDEKSEDKELSRFIMSLYDIDKIDDKEFNNWIETYSYKGFDREKVLIDLKKRVPDVKICQQIIIVCGLNGPKRAAKTVLINGKSIESYGIPSSGMKGSTGVSCQRITASTADLCAYFLKKSKYAGQIISDLPAWLQFPSAGAIKMPDYLRKQHVEFSKRFSILIGGSFNEKIYQQMIANAYLDDKLKLF